MSVDGQSLGSRGSALSRVYVFARVHIHICTLLRISLRHDVRWSLSSARTVPLFLVKLMLDAVRVLGDPNVSLANSKRGSLL